MKLQPRSLAFKVMVMSAIAAMAMAVVTYVFVLAPVYSAIGADDKSEAEKIQMINQSEDNAHVIYFMDGALAVTFIASSIIASKASSKKKQDG